MTTDPFTSVQPTTGQDKEPANVERDQYGRYKIPPLPADFRDQFKAKGYADPGPGVKSWTRATTLAKTISDTFGLSQWSQRMVAKGIAARPDLYAGAAACQLSDKKTLDSIVDQAKDAAASRAGANLGTAYHSFTEAIDRGEDPVIPVAEWRRDLDAYRDLIVKHGLTVRPEYIERTVVNTRWGVAGTFDRIYGNKIGDVKSGKSMEYDNTHLEISIQLLVYATADAIWDWDRRVFLPMPDDMDTREALVVHLPVGKGAAELYRVDIARAAMGADLCVAVREWRKTKGMFKVASEAPDYGTPEDRPAEPSTVQDRAVQVNGETIKVRPLAPGSDSFSVVREEPAARVQLEAEAIEAANLAPLAGPGQKGCSVCRRTGHRKGSPKCLGANDPAKLEDTDVNGQPVPNPDAETNTERTERETAAWCLRSPSCIAAGWSTDEAGVSRCGRCGKPSRSGMISGTGQPVTGTIGTERRPENKGEAAFTEIEAEDVADNGPADLFTSVTVKEPSLLDMARSVVGSSLAPDDVVNDAEQIIHDHETGQTDEDGGDPFADAEEPAPTWEDRVRAATSKADMRAIRAEATEAGAWTPELTKLGIKVLSEIDRK